MNDHDALQLLDRRMSAASAELHTAIANALGESSPAVEDQANANETSIRLASDAPLEGSEIPPVRHRRWQWAAVAAAIVIAAGLAAVLVFVDGDDDEAPTNPTEQPYLLPDRLPEGWAPLEAQVIAPTATQPPTVTVYSDSDADPWWESDRHLTVMSTDVTDVTTTLEAEQIDIAGHDATIESDGDTWVVTVPLDQEQVVVSGSGVAREAIVAVAEAAADGAPLEPAIPAGMVEAASGSIDAFGGLYSATTFAVGYGAAPNEPGVGIGQRRGEASEVGLIGLYLIDVPPTETTVRGQPAVKLAVSDPSSGNSTIVQWFEPPGLLVTVIAEGMSDDELDRLLDGLSPATGDEIDALLETYPASPTTADSGESSTENALPSDAVAVAEGERAGNRWRVTATNGDDSTEVSYEDERGGFGFGTDGGPGDRRHLDVSTASWQDSAGLVPTIGLAGRAITEVVAEAPGRPPHSLELHRPEEVDQSVFVGFVPREYIGGEVVGRDAAGAVVARAPLTGMGEFVDEDGDGDGSFEYTPATGAD
jgi:hypothetical protein